MTAPRPRRLLTSMIRVVSIFALIFVFSGSLIAQNIPLRNWTVPSAPSGSKLIKQSDTDVNFAAAFVPVTPCRVYDSRVIAGGPGPVTGGTSRTIPVSAGPCPGIGPPSAPANAPTAFSLNLTVTNSAPAAGTAFGTAYPTGTTRPPVSSINFAMGAQVANAAIVPAGTAGAIDFYASYTTEVIVDINGYWAISLNNTGQQFQMTVNRSGAAAIYGGNTSGGTGSHAGGFYESGAGIVHGVQGETSTNALSGSSGVHGIQDSSNSTVYGVLGQVVSTAPGGFSTAVRGINNGTAGSGIGGWFQQNGSGWGVYSTAGSGGIGVLTSVGGAGTGVYTSSSTGNAVFAFQTSTTAPADSTTIYAQTATQSANRTYAIMGQTNSSASNAAGVVGIEASGYPAWYAGDINRIPSGVVGLSKSNVGVFGKSEYIAIDGLRMNADGTGAVQGILGYAGYAFYGVGDFATTGTKAFIEPHPTDAAKVIKYIALEGPESGTYFRGRGKFVNHRAVIDVPESFRIVTDQEGLTVNITPMGGIASVGVMNADLNSIEVESTKDVAFSYLVQGFRKAYRDFQPVVPGDEFAPRTPESRMPDSLSAEAQRRLIANGTYNADGTPNLGTAERLGWAKQWRDRADAAAKQAEEVNKATAARDAAIKQQQQMQ